MATLAYQTTRAGLSVSASCRLRVSGLWVLVLALPGPMAEFPNGVSAAFFVASVFNVCNVARLSHCCCRFRLRFWFAFADCVGLRQVHPQCAASANSADAKHTSNHFTSAYPLSTLPSPFPSRPVQGETWLLRSSWLLPSA